LASTLVTGTFYRLLDRRRAGRKETAGKVLPARKNWETLDRQSGGHKEKKMAIMRAGKPLPRIEGRQRHLMATVTVSGARFTNVAELQEFLGNIPDHRIRLQPPPGQATEEDILAIQAREGRLCELIDGILVEKDMASFESRLGCILIYFLEMFLEKNDLGVILGEAGFLRLFPGRVRAPDVSYIAWKNMPNEEFPREKIAPLTPDLAVEILSEGNTPGEMQRKLREYFQAGSRLVWYVDPENRTVRVYTSPRKSRLLTEEDTLDGGKVLPGFSLPIKKWFARASRKPRR
jgi:Uma2 family endonuclease